MANASLTEQNKHSDTTALVVDHLCVVSPSRLDEACFSVPAIRALKNSGAAGQLTILSPHSLAAFWNHVPEIDQVLTCPDHFNSRKWLAHLRAADFSCDAALLWEPGACAKALARLGIERRIGYPAQNLKKWLSQPVERVVEPGPIEHRIRYYMDLVEMLGADAYVKSNFSCPSRGAPSPTANDIKVALVEGSDFGEAYGWSQESFASVRSLLETELNTVEWVLPKGDWGEQLHTLSQCDALLASDGSVAHLAAYLGLPAVVMFGPNEPAWKRPLGKQSRVLREHVACSPCCLSKCPLDSRCQSAISIDSVAAELKAILTEKLG